MNKYVWFACIVLVLIMFTTWKWFSHDNKSNEPINELPKPDMSIDEVIDRYNMIRPLDYQVHPQTGEHSLRLFNQIWTPQARALLENQLRAVANDPVKAKEFFASIYKPTLRYRTIYRFNSPVYVWIGAGMRDIPNFRYELKKN